jgi:hypothetical protein
MVSLIASVFIGVETTQTVLLGAYCMPTVGSNKEYTQLDSLATPTLKVHYYGNTDATYPGIMQVTQVQYVPCLKSTACKQSRFEKGLSNHVVNLNQGDRHRPV